MKNKTLLSESGLSTFKISELSGLRNGIVNQTAAEEMSGQDSDRSMMQTPTSPEVPEDEGRPRVGSEVTKSSITVEDQPTVNR